MTCAMVFSTISIIMVKLSTRKLSHIHIYAFYSTELAFPLWFQCHYFKTPFENTGPMVDIFRTLNLQIEMWQSNLKNALKKKLSHIDLMIWFYSPLTMKFSCSQWGISSSSMSLIKRHRYLKKNIQNLMNMSGRTNRASAIRQPIS